MQFVLQDQNQEVLAINTMLRSELDEIRKENEAYKQLKQHTMTGGDDDLAESPKNKTPANKAPADVKSTVTTAVLKTGLRKTKRRQGRGKQEKE